MKLLLIGLLLILSACGDDAPMVTDEIQPTISFEDMKTRVESQFLDYKAICRANYSNGYRGFDETKFQALWTLIEKATILELENCVYHGLPSPVPCDTVTLKYLSFRVDLECY